MIKNNEKEAEKGPIVNRSECKNYVKCLEKFSLRNVILCQKFDENAEISCEGCCRYEK